jgi:hypothetical protein
MFIGIPPEALFAVRVKAHPSPMAQNNSRGYSWSNGWYAFLVIPE